MKIVNRIKKNEDFALTIKNGRVFHNSSFTIYVCLNSLNHFRVGISVSKKVGDAVTRNRIKRQVRAICDDLLDYNQGSSDIVIIIRPKFLEKDFWANRDKLQELLNLGRN